MAKVVFEVSVPDLYLGTASQIDAAVSAFENLPIDVKFEVAVILAGTQAFPLSIEHEHTINDLPVCSHHFVRFLLGGRQFFHRHRRSCLRIPHQPFPAGQVGTVEQRCEAGRRSRLRC